MESVKPDIMMLAEASKPELLVKAFDIDYAWPLMGALNDVLLNGAPASKLRASWEESRRQFPRGALHMRISDDHDEPRAVARFGIRGALAASALDVHTGRRAAALQWDGSGRRDGIRRPGVVRKAADFLVAEETAARCARFIADLIRLREGPRGVPRRARRVAVQFEGGQPRHVQAGGRSVGISWW